MTSTVAEINIGVALLLEDYSTSTGIRRSKEEAIDRGCGLVYTLGSSPHAYSFTITALLMDYTGV